MKKRLSKSKSRSSFGVALSGGGASGFIQLGILEVLKKHKIKIDCLSGTSMGALLGVGYSLGMSSEEIIRLCMDFSKKKFISISNLNIFNTSLVKMKVFDKILDSVVGKKTFKDCKIPISIVTVDLESGKKVVYDSGPLLPVLKATTATPFLMPPVFHENRLLVDGGLIDNVPVDVLKEKCHPKTILGVRIRNFSARKDLLVDIFQHYYAPRFKNFFKPHNFFRRMKENIHLSMDIGLRSLEIAIDSKSKTLVDVNKPDIMLLPTTDVRFAEFNRCSEAYQQGIELMEKELPKLRKLLKANK